MKALALAALAVACGDRSRDDAIGSSAPSGSSTEPARRLPDGAIELAIPGRRGPTELVRGARRIGIVDGRRWFAAEAGALREDPAIGQQLAAACGDQDRTLFLARDPIATCGEEHHERTTRLRTRRAVEVSGTPLRAVAFADGEVWVVEERLATSLVVDRDGTVTGHPPFERTGALPDSPVRARACAAARIADLAGDGVEAVALIVECDPTAPVRIARIAAGKPLVVTPVGRLDFVPERIAIAAGVVAIAGHRGDELAIARLGPETPTMLAGPRPAAQVTGLEVTDAGAIWALTVGTRDRRDVWTLSRDGAAVPLGPISPRALGHDAVLGIVVTAADGAVLAWRAR